LEFGVLDKLFVAFECDIVGIELWFKFSDVARCDNNDLFIGMQGDQVLEKCQLLAAVTGVYTVVEAFNGNSC